MTSNTEVIILSSSPNTPVRTPTRSCNDAESSRDILPRSTTPPPLPSASHSPDLPSRSRFFAESNVNDKGARKKRQPTKKAVSAGNTNEEKTPNKPLKRGKQLAKDSNTTTFGDQAPGSLDPRDNTTKKPPGPEKGRKKTNAKSKGSGNMTLAGKVTKAKGDTEPKKSKKTKKRPSTTPKEDDMRELDTLGNDEDLHLQEAMRRRLDWTPPRETAPGDIIAAKGEDDTQTCDGTMDGFGKLLSDYNFTRAPPESQTLLNGDGAGLTKRRRIELVNSHIQPHPGKSGLDGESSAQGDDSSSGTKQKKKPKAPKRPTTLTARMTAQYKLTEESGEGVEDLTQHFEKTRSSRGKGKTTENDSTCTILSPAAAAKALDDQDLVFGTCSQLEREDSPQGLQEIQQAIKESERLSITGNMSGVAQINAPRLASTSSASRLKGTKKMWSVAARDEDGSLARAKEADVCDLTSTSPVPPILDVNARKPKAALDDEWFELDYGKPGPSKVRAPLAEKNTRPSVDVQSSSAEATSRAVDIRVQQASAVPAPQPSMPHYSGFTDAELSKQIASYGFKSVRGRKKMIDLLQKCWESKCGSIDRPLGTQSKPQTGDARLTASPEPPVHEFSIPSTGPCSELKPQRQKKPTQKKTCYPLPETRAHASTTAPLSKTPSEPARSRRIPSSPSSIDVDEIQDSQEEITPSPISTPQKTSKSGHIPSSSSYIDIDEIQDSEDELILSPSMVQKRYTDIFSNLGSSAREPSLEMATKTMPRRPSEPKPNHTKATTMKKTLARASPVKKKQQPLNLPDISAQIMKAVRGQSRPPQRSSTSSRSHPTWHEKILMYDPIILEDFTTWLNVEGLGLVGEDREVSTIDVREWCEGKGICCCWKNSATW